MKRRLVAAACAVAIAACVSTPKAPPNPGPRFPEFVEPVIPAALGAAPAVRERMAFGWQRLQMGDVRAASREFTAVLAQAPGFYPAETALGFAALADRQFRAAADRFASALSRDNRYLPAWQGLVDAQLGLENFDEAIAGLDRILAIEPKREADRTRLEVLRFRQMQSMIQSGRQVRQAGRPAEADAILTRALALFPASVVILSELAGVEVTTGQLEEAEMHARRAVQLDPNDAGAQSVLGDVLTARGLRRDAAAAYARAASIDPAWRAKADAARALADAADVPVELGDIATAASVTRGQFAALIGMRLGPVVERAPRKGPQVATDIRGHWATTWIVAVTQAGILEVFPDHTFQPAGVVRRGDLAQAVTELVNLTQAGRGDQLAQWTAARPVFPDVASSNTFYRPAALAVAAGAMTVDATGSFQATRPATGAEVLAALSRIERLALR